MYGDVHINIPTSSRFIARVRRVGCRKYILVGKPQKYLDRAIKIMAASFAEGSYKRGDVILTADYYDPVVLVEMVRL